MERIDVIGQNGNDGLHYETDLSEHYDDDFFIVLNDSVYRRIKGSVYFFGGKFWKMAIVQNWNMMIERGSKVYDNEAV